MIIGIDGNEANQKIRVGSGIYAFEILKHLNKYQISNIRYQIYLKNKPISDFPPVSDFWNYQIIKPTYLWTQFSLPVRLWKEKLINKSPDVFLSLTHYAPRFCPVPSVITIFDLSFLRFPEMFLPHDLYKLKNWTKYSVKQAKKIITISEFSKKEIISYYHIPQDKVVVAYPGYDREKFKIQNSKFKIEKIKEKYKISGEYILYVGTIQPRKNVVRLIEAFELLSKPELKLVICGMINEGRGGWMSDEIIHQAQNSKLNPSTSLRARTQNKIIMTGYIKNEDLPYLMAGTKVLVLPSLYEGFGIPALEAMACGVPVVVSNNSSLPEVVGNAGILVDPYDIGEISSGIENLLFDQARREKCIERGLERVKMFSWEKSAEKILEVLKEGQI